MSLSRKRISLSLNKASSPKAGCSKDLKKSLDTVSPNNNNHGNLSSDGDQSTKEDCHASSEPKNAYQHYEKSPLTGRLLKSVRTSDSSTTQKCESQEASTSASPVYKLQSTPKRHNEDLSDASDKPCTPSDQLLELEDEYSPLERFPGTQVQALVRWEWRVPLSPDSAADARKRSLRRQASKRLRESIEDTTPPPPRKPRFQKCTLSEELTPLEIELTAIREQILASGDYKHLFSSNKEDKEEKVPENDSDDPLFRYEPLNDFHEFGESSGTESLLCPALTQQAGPSNVSEVQNSSPVKKLSGVRKLKSDNSKSIVESVPERVEHHDNDEDTNRNDIPTEQKIQTQSVKPVLAEKNIGNSQNKKVSNPVLIDLEMEADKETVVGKNLKVPSDKNILFNDDSMNEMIMACSMQIEEEIRLSQEKQKEKLKNSSVINNKTVPQVEKNNQPTTINRVNQPINTVKNSHTCVSSFPSHSSSQIFPVATKTSSSSSFKTILPTRKSPRIQNQSAKVPPFQRSKSPARKMPVVSISKNEREFSPKWVENIKMATSPLNSTLSTRSTSQTVFMKPVSPLKTSEIRKPQENKNISRNLFLKTAPLKQFHSKPSCSTQSAPKQPVVAEQPALAKQPTPSSTNEKKAVDLNRSYDIFGDSIDLSDLGEIEQIEATYQSQCTQASQAQPVKPQGITTVLTRSVTLSTVSSQTCAKQETKLENKIPMKTNSNIVTIDLTQKNVTLPNSKPNGEVKASQSQNHHYNSTQYQPNPTNSSKMKPSLPTTAFKPPVTSNQLGSQRSIPITRSSASSQSQSNATTATQSNTFSRNVPQNPSKSSESHNIVPSQQPQRRNEFNLDDILKSSNVGQQPTKVVNSANPRPTVPPSKVTNNQIPKVGGSPLMRHKSASDFTAKSGASRNGPQLRSSPLVRHRSVGNYNSLSQKYSIEDIERKRLEAQQRLQQRRLEQTKSEQQQKQQQSRKK